MNNENQFPHGYLDADPQMEDNYSVDYDINEANPAFFGRGFLYGYRRRFPFYRPYPYPFFFHRHYPYYPPYQHYPCKPYPGCHHGRCCGPRHY